MPCSPGMAKCARSCRHRAFVRDYQRERERQVDEKDAAVGTFGPGTQEWDEYTPQPVVFGEWLRQMKGWGQ